MEPTNLNKDFDLLDAYDSIETIEGGMSLIKVCHSKIDEEIIVVKIPKTTSLTDNATRALWLFESRNWLNVGNHDNIVGFRRMHFANGMPHLIFDYVGNNLRKSINSISFEEIITISIGICEALIHLQSKLSSFVHKDLKPENILLDKNKIPKLADLGVSYSTKNREIFNNENKYYYDVNLQFKSELNYGGTHQYMSPEQIERKEITLASDIYSFGLILYEMMTGKVYYYDNSKLNFDYVKKRLSLSNNHFDCLYYIIQNCIKYNISDRYKSFNDISKQLKILYHQVTNKKFIDPSVKPLEDGKLFGFIDSLIKFGEFDEALILMKELKNEIERLSLTAKIENRLGNYKQAIELSLRGIDMLTHKNKSFELFLLEQLTNGYSGDKQFESAISIKLKIAELTPNNSINYFKLGEDYAKYGDYTTAEKYLLKSLTLSSYLPTYDLLFSIQTRLKKYNEILIKLNEIEPFYKYDPQYYRIRARRVFVIAFKLIEETKKINMQSLKLYIEAEEYFNKLKKIEQLSQEDTHILDLISNVIKKFA